MAAGFERLYDDVFVASRGSRATAAKYVILLTDGTTSRQPDYTQFHVSISASASQHASQCHFVVFTRWR